MNGYEIERDQARTLADALGPREPAPIREDDDHQCDPDGCGFPACRDSCPCPLHEEVALMAAPPADASPTAKAPAKPKPKPAKDPGRQIRLTIGARGEITAAHMRTQGRRWEVIPPEDAQRFIAARRKRGKHRDPRMPELEAEGMAILAKFDGDDVVTRFSNFMADLMRRPTPRGRRPTAAEVVPAEMAKPPAEAWGEDERP